MAAERPLGTATAAGAPAPTELSAGASAGAALGGPTAAAVLAGAPQTDTGGTPPAPPGAAVPVAAAAPAAAGTPLGAAAAAGTAAAGTAATGAVAAPEGAAAAIPPTGHSPCPSGVLQPTAAAMGASAPFVAAAPTTAPTTAAATTAAPTTAAATTTAPATAAAAAAAPTAAAPPTAATATAAGTTAAPAGGESAELSQRFALFGAAVASAQRGLQGIFAPDGAPQQTLGAPDLSLPGAPVIGGAPLGAPVGPPVGGPGGPLRMTGPLGMAQATYLLQRTRLGPLLGPPTLASFDDPSRLPPLFPHLASIQIPRLVPPTTLAAPHAAATAAAAAAAAAAGPPLLPQPAAAPLSGAAAAGQPPIAAQQSLGDAANSTGAGGGGAAAAAAPQSPEPQRAPGEPLESVAAWYRRRYGTGGGLSVSVSSKARDYGGVLRSLKRFEALCADRRQRSREAIAEDRRYVLCDVLRCFTPFQVVLRASKPNRLRGPMGGPLETPQGGPPVRGEEASLSDMTSIKTDIKRDTGDPTDTEAAATAVAAAAPASAAKAPDGADAKGVPPQQSEQPVDVSTPAAAPPPAAAAAADGAAAGGKVSPRKRRRRGMRAEAYVSADEVVKALLPYHSFYIQDAKLLAPDAEGPAEIEAREQRVSALTQRVGLASRRVANPLAAAAEPQSPRTKRLWDYLCCRSSADALLLATRAAKAEPQPPPVRPAAFQTLPAAPAAAAGSSSSSSVPHSLSLMPHVAGVGSGSSTLGGPGGAPAAAHSSPASRVSSVELGGSSDDDHASAVSSSIGGPP